MNRDKNTVVELLGRRLRLGVVGGGAGSFIGEVHRTAARVDDRYHLVASALSSNAERGLAGGKALGIPRPYGSWQEMLSGEAGREDGMDVVAVMTPNDSHGEICMAMLRGGMHVLCDKPLTNTLAEGEDLAACVKETGKVFCLTFNYSGFPMVRQARAMLKAGVLGDIRQVQAEYIQGHNASLVEKAADANWRFNPEKGGQSLVLGDIASHAQHLVCSTGGLRVEKVLADVGATVPGRVVDDYAGLLLQLENGVRGSMWITNAAAGGEHGLSFRIFGVKGGLEWRQEQPNELHHRQADGFMQVLTRRRDGKLTAAAEAASRVGRGHPEGYQEAFANLYTEVAEAVAASMAGKPCPEWASYFPTVHDGVENLHFTAAVIESSAKGQWVAVKH